MPNVLEPPLSGAVAPQDMFENLVSDNIDSFFGRGSFVSIADARKKAMEIQYPEADSQPAWKKNSPLSTPGPRGMNAPTKTMVIVHDHLTCTET